MCTISWFVDKHEYSVFFNRDESGKRPTALPPNIYSNSTNQHIMPVDPQGGGSWLAVNQSGLTFALLNYYQGRLPKGRLNSRGQIIKDIVSCSSLEEVALWLTSLNLQKYPPFSLLVFTLDLLQDNLSFPSVPLYCWNGKTLEYEFKRSPMFSSAVDFEDVRCTRESLYENMIFKKELVTTEDFLQLHRSHLPEKSRLSICMHREDANTVSFSQVSVNKSEINFYYADGAPCQSLLQKAVSLPVILKHKQLPPSQNLQRL